MDRARYNAALDNLPKAPDLSGKNATLTREITKANQEIVRSLNVGTKGSELGRKVGELGRLYQANHFYDQAITCYELAMEEEPEKPHWPYLLAFVRQERGESESILNLLEKTLSLAPAYSPAVLRMADIHFKNGDTNQARVFYEKRLKLQQGDPHALLGLARIAVKHSQWKIARTRLQEAVRLNPEFGNAHRLLAAVYEHDGNEEKMRDSLGRASKCTRFRPAADPWVEDLNARCYDVDQLLVLGSKAIAKLDIEKASRFFGRAKELDPENPQVHMALGRLYFMVGQREQARVFFEKAIDLDPKSDEAYFQLGVILRREGKLKEAKQMFLLALDFHPDNPNVHNNLGVTLLELRKFREAVEALNKALEIYPEHINARYNLGLALWSLGKTEPAVQEYRKILSVKPNWAIPANSLAWILATDRNKKLRNGIEAVQWALIACKNDGRKNPEYLDTLAAAYAEAGRFQEAVRTARKSLNLARSAGDVDLAEEVEKRLLLYKAEKPFTE
ncbi:MAG: tetratricopeptide repeat protein [Deltaproteobacteria bacterium]|nr:tetratricopeptide repeat protein [Deltaproteobacteria bacterium]